ncbi:glutathione S-transferase family protein [Bordetella bronchialis]|uniref:Glutathione S-transferase n=1 Tax=Bordetella bronchialis TaxID=463025 RepID=A0A193FST0_9BORD|nr:glutathione S-transferase family protein [Bordetella bronchialis]ANN70685.1 glutathione S-transferase [Bordetella bronchialis]
MALQLYFHPFSSYCQKVLIPLYDNGIPFESRIVEGPDSPAGRELAERWPMKRFPMLVDGDRTVMEATCIVEYLDLVHPGPARMIPADPAEALETRFMDRFFENYIATPVQQIVFNEMRPEAARDPYGVRNWRGMLDTAYAWLDRKMADRTWAAGDRFSLADCGAAPHLFYADWTHPIPAACGNVRAYRARLLEHPSFARAVDDARPYRAWFPLGAPDRD